VRIRPLNSDPSPSACVSSNWKEFKSDIALLASNVIDIGFIGVGDGSIL